MKALIDTCVIVDILQKRDPFMQQRWKSFSQYQTKNVPGFSLPNPLRIFTISCDGVYTMNRKFVSWSAFFYSFEVVDTFSIDCELALSSTIKDYEDAIMVETGSRVGAECVVTRNLKDYKLSALPVLSPDQFLEQMRKAEESDSFNLCFPEFEIPEASRLRDFKLISNSRTV